MENPPNSRRKCETLEDLYKHCSQVFHPGLKGGLLLKDMDEDPTGPSISECWLAPIESTHALTTIEVMDVQISRGFLMLAQMSAHNSGWRESTRWVLVDDDWGSRVVETMPTST